MEITTPTIETPMTVAQREAIEIEASSIRDGWLLDRDRDRSKAHDAPVSAAPEGRPASPKLTAEEYISNVTARRPLGPHDLVHITALMADELSPHWLKSREQRRARKQLLRYLKCPDLTGLSSPDEQALKDNPDLKAKWDDQIKNGFSVFNPRR
jgi:hypothetical protein